MTLRPSLVAQLMKNPPAMLDLGLISGLGRSPGERNDYPLWYSDLENSRDCIVHEVAKSRTQLSNFHFTLLYWPWRHLCSEVASNWRGYLKFGWFLKVSKIFCLPMQETLVRSLIWEDPPCCGATTPMRNNSWACALEPGSHNYGVEWLQLLKPTCPGPHSLQQEKPLQ